MVQSVEKKKCDTFKKMLGFTQKELKEYVENILKNNGYKPTIGDGFIYAEGEVPILLVAHLDTIHKYPPTEIFYDTEQDVMWSPEGIGGDDRCGVYTILKLIKKYKPYVLFTEDEEIGCLGAKKAVKILKKPSVKFIIEVDRRGSDDCVFYSCDNKEFKKYIESFGFETAIGSCSDICTLSDAWDIASVNLSIGYYREHTNSEYIKIEEMKATYERIKDILKDEKNAIEYKYEPKVYQYKFPLSNEKKEEKEDKEEKKVKDLGYKAQRPPYKEGNYYDEWGYEDDDGNWWWWTESSLYL